MIAYRSLPPYLRQVADPEPAAPVAPAPLIRFAILDPAGRRRFVIRAPDERRARRRAYWALKHEGLVPSDLTAVALGTVPA